VRNVFVIHILHSNIILIVSFTKHNKAVTSEALFVKVVFRSCDNVNVQVPIEQHSAPSEVDSVLPVVREMAAGDRYVLSLFIH